MASDENPLRPWLYSLAVHLAVLAIVSVSLWWTRSTVAVSIPGPIIEATLVGPAQAPKPKAVKPKPKPVEAKPPEPKPQAEEPAPEPPKEDKKDQEKVTDKLTQLKAEEDARLQEELKKKEQVELAEKQAAEAEKQKKLKEEKEQQQRDKKARELAAKAEAEHLAAMIAEEAKTGQEGTDASLEAEYYAAIQSAVTAAWLRPDTTPARSALHTGDHADHWWRRDPGCGRQPVQWRCGDSNDAGAGAAPRVAAALLGLRVGVQAQDPFRVHL